MSQKPEYNFAIGGMHCVSCATLIEKRVSKLPGVLECSVSPVTEEARVVVQENTGTESDFAAKVTKTVAELGYTANLIAAPHSQAPETKNGSAIFEQSSSVAQATAAERVATKLAGLRGQLLFLAPMMVVSAVMMVWELAAQYTEFVPPMSAVLSGFLHHLLPIFATYALFVVGASYLHAIGRFARQRIANMDTLMGIGTATAFVYSFVISAFEDTLAPFLDVSQSYYDVTIVVIGFITLGKYLEVRFKARTGAALEKLLQLQPKTATLLKNGKQEIVAVESLVAGDHILVKPGALIPIDGTVVGGGSFVDESMITGESVPIEKIIGANVVGATQNLRGSLEIVVDRVGSETMLAQIITMVGKAQASRAPIEKLVNVVSGVFVPVVMVLAIVVAAAWLVIGGMFLPFSEALTLSVVSFVGILVIACPCALGLATPMAMVVGMGRAAQAGILVKDAESIERLHSVTEVILDKTGTLTEGKPVVTDVVAINQKQSSAAQKNIMTIAASLEAHSEHPLATAVLAYAEQHKLSVSAVKNFQALEGKGVSGMISGKQYYLGTPRLAQELAIPITQAVLDAQEEQGGKTALLLMTTSEIIAVIAVADQLKKDARLVVQRLQGSGLQVTLLTGDNKATAQYIARQAGITTVIAEVLPSAKAEYVEQRKKTGAVVAMVGDGINDAVALSVADVGIAMGTGTDVAIESAGITLLGGSLHKLPQAIELSRETFRVVRQNLFWAFFYNVISIPVAAGLLYPWGIMLNPAIAGGAMAFSSVTVVLNALRLARRRV